MNYRAESELGALAEALLSDLERVRPGLPEGASADEVQKALGARVHLRLAELYRELHEGESPESQGEQLDLYRREIDQILVPRYAVLAQRQNRLEQAPVRPWRGGDAYNRAAWATFFFLWGVFVVWAPFIPIWEKWVPFALSAAAVWLSPFLPDLHGRFFRRRHELGLLALLIDVDRTGKALPVAPDLTALPPAPPPPPALPGAKAPGE